MEQQSRIVAYLSFKELFMGGHFNGGTLVEYVEGSMGSLEWNRARITDVSPVVSTGLQISTDGRAKLGIGDPEFFSFLRGPDGVFHISDVYGGAYALVPKGVNIPEKPKGEGLADRIAKILQEQPQN